MNVGIGLPATIAGVQPEQLIEWAKRAERRGFSTLGTIDRIVYGNYEPLIALAAAAAVTERIGLTTAILIAPYRANARSWPSRPHPSTRSRRAASRSASPSAGARTTTRPPASTSARAARPWTRC